MTTEYQSHAATGVSESGTDYGQGFLATVIAGLLSVTQKIALISVLAILLIAFAVVLDILLRTFFRTTIFGLNEIRTLLVAVAVSTCLPYALARGAALSIKIVTEHFSRQMQGVVDFLAKLMVFAFFGILSMRIFVVALRMASAGETTMMTSLPKAPFFYVVSVAVGAAAIMMGLLALQAWLWAWRQRPMRAFYACTGVALPILAGAFAIIYGSSWAGKLLGPVVPDNPIMLAALALVSLWILILLSVPIGVAMGTVGLLGTIAILGPRPSLSVLGMETTGFITQDGLSVLPLFLMMGAFAGVAGIGRDMYNLSNALLGHVRGGLAHASIVACAGFGTLSGSSIATQMSIGKIALGEMKSRNYSAELASGTIAAGGTLGQLIPPSSALILYAILTEESIGRLFAGAVFPGILAAMLYMATISLWVRFKPSHAESSSFAGWANIAHAARNAWSVLLLLTLVLGGIFTGIFTELEAGAVGAAGAFIIAVARGKINRSTFWGTMADMTGSLAMMYSLIFGVVMLSFFFGISGLPQAFLDAVNHIGLTPFATILAIIGCYLVLGTAMDSFAMMVVTVPIFVPVVMALGYDPIWWGLMTIVCMEAGAISPPFGLNMFIISALDKSIPITKVYRGVTPFFVSTLVKIIILIAFPAIVTWLPSRI